MPTWSVSCTCIAGETNGNVGDVVPTYGRLNTRRPTTVLAGLKVVQAELLGDATSAEAPRCRTITAVGATPGHATLPGALPARSVYAQTAVV